MNDDVTLVQGHWLQFNFVTIQNPKPHFWERYLCRRICKELAGDSPQRCRVRNGASHTGKKGKDGRRGGTCRCRSSCDRRPSFPLWVHSAACVIPFCRKREASTREGSHCLINQPMTRTGKDAKRDLLPARARNWSRGSHRRPNLITVKNE